MESAKSHIHFQWQALEDAFSRILRINAFEGGRHMEKVLFTVGGRPYNVATTTLLNGFDEGGALNSASD